MLTEYVTVLTTKGCTIFWLTSGVHSRKPGIEEKGVWESGQVYHFKGNNTS